MDIKLSNGDWQTNERGNVVSIDADEEIFQRCENALKIPLGSFVYDNSLGSELYKISQYEKGASENFALQAAKRAIQKIENARVLGCKINESSGFAKKITVSLECGNTLREVSIDLD